MHKYLLHESPIEQKVSIIWYKKGDNIISSAKSKRQTHSNTVARYPVPDDMPKVVIALVALRLVAEAALPGYGGGLGVYGGYGGYGGG
ncbi:hypothetical protein CHS0354_017669 [Potamilus streckersoni]|uniref:Uncharacterized protein n=1 Tax=Potamilus streckersoni TaxID=2493646 RepID=A0AAE0VRX4_9BIVA|nr:hypothetical protein CHS0354_017669 [Potamilus streckersoni]